MHDRPPALIFDLDGTLVDTLPDLAAAANRLLADLDRAPIDAGAVRAMVGRGMATLARRLLEATGGAPAGVDAGDLAKRYRAHYEARGHAASAPFPQVADTLATLAKRGCAMAVCTNKPGAPARALLAHCGLDGFFGAVVGGDDCAHNKPDPRHVDAALQRLLAPPEAAAMVGDSDNDVRAARGAGVAAIVVAHGYSTIPPRQLGADQVIAGFDALPGALGAVFAARRASLDSGDRRFL